MLQFRIFEILFKFLQVSHVSLNKSEQPKHSEIFGSGLENILSEWAYMGMAPNEVHFTCTRAI